LSPLCPTERAKSGDPLGASNCVNGSLGVGRSAGSVGGPVGVGPVVVGFSSAVKKNLHKKSTSVGNMVGSGSVATVVDLKSNNVSSLPGMLRICLIIVLDLRQTYLPHADMLDSPISGNSASTRSSSDSYSSSSSTKQLLSSNPTTTAANIIVDDKTALQNAVNV